MAPAVVIDNTPDLDFDYTPTKSPINNAARTLLLAPPSLASSPDLLTELSAAYDRRTTDIQMLDRLELGLVSLPAATYDLALLLPASSSSSSLDAVSSAAALLTRDLLAHLVPALKVSGVLRVHERIASPAESSSFPAAAQTEAILAGLVAAPDGRGMVKPDPAAATQTVRLRFGGKRKIGTADAATSTTVPTTPAVPTAGGSAGATAGIPEQGIVGLGGESASNGKRKNGEGAPAGVGFVNGDERDADMEEDEEEEFPSNEELESAAAIDPESLLTAEDRLKPLNIPEACKPNSKRRRACKDCTCGLAERLEAEDKATRAQADANLARLDADDLNEVDFTVKGKVGSCGNCALGDAFRCDGCPYIGLPAFKPGEEVRLLNNDIQL